MKIKDQSSLPILYKDGAVRCRTMHMVMCIWCCKWYCMYNAFISMGWSRRRKRCPQRNKNIYTRSGDWFTKATWSYYSWHQVIKPIRGIKWPHNLNLSTNSNLIRIPIRLTSRCEKKVKFGTQQSVTYYAHAVDLAFAITVWKCQGGTFDYIIAMLEHFPGSPTLTFGNLYVMFARVKMACSFWCFPLSPAFNKAKLYNIRPKILATKWTMDINESGYWKPHVANSPALSYQKYQKFCCP